MSEGRDVRMEQFLRANAPPTRDPVFRLKVLERREQRDFQRRLVTMFAGVLVMLLVLGYYLSTGERALVPAGALAVGAALASASLAFRGRLLGIFRRFSI